MPTVVPALGSVATSGTGMMGHEVGFIRSKADAAVAQSNAAVSAMIAAIAILPANSILIVIRNCETSATLKLPQLYAATRVRQSFSARCDEQKWQSWREG